MLSYKTKVDSHCRWETYEHSTQELPQQREDQYITRMARHIVGNTSLILDTGRLVRPGDPVAALGGDTDPIQEGHISKTRWRWNKYTWDWKFFDPRQIFFSPTIRYCELPHYAKEARKGVTT